MTSRTTEGINVLFFSVTTASLAGVSTTHAKLPSEKKTVELLLCRENWMEEVLLILKPTIKSAKSVLIWYGGGLTVATIFHLRKA